MAKSYGAGNNPGMYRPTTTIFEQGQIVKTAPGSPEFKSLLGRLYETVNRIEFAINLKETAYYLEEEILNSQLFFANPNLTSQTPQTPILRNAFRKVINFGALPNNTSKSVAHGIDFTTGDFTFTRIYATATQPTNTNFIPIPYASASGTTNIELNVTATNVVITTASNRTAFTRCFVILEYIKS